MNIKEGRIYLKNNIESFDKRNILGIKVRSKTREVDSWEQPLLSIEPKTFLLIISKKADEIYILVSLGIGPGLFTEFEILLSFGI